jgi:cytochrome c5
VSGVRGTAGFVLTIAVLLTVAWGCGGSESAASPPPATTDAGERTWMATCEKCHGAGGLGDAPAIGDRAAWEPRIAKGMDTLTSHAVNGFTGTIGEMPARGGNPRLADAEVRAALDYMVQKSR